MTFEEIIDQAVAMLQRRGQMTYRTLKRQFTLDDEALEDLKEELLYSHPVRDDNGRGLIWTGAPDTTPDPVTTTQLQQPTEQEGPSTQPEPPTPDAERRHLTVMFCDLADSTRLSGQLDPEDLRDVIRAYQSACAEVIERYDGYIAQHLGDGLMVYYGWPQAHEDDAQRAVHTGLGILEAMAGLNARLEHEKGIRLAVRIGIHTGPVVVGEIGKGASQEHLALGETPNIASRIDGIAEPDTVAISDATFQLVEGYFACDDLGLHDLKGVAKAMQTYQVLQTTGVHGRLDAAIQRDLTPLVGREAEVTLLVERWEQVKDSQGQVVLLSGEAGIGKSRLLQVMKDHVAVDAHALFECRSSPYYQNTALYPITDMLQRVLNWNHDDTPEVKLRKLEQTLRAYRLEWDEAIPLFANLLSLTIPEDGYPPLNISPQQQRRKTLETIVAMLLQQAEGQPVLFILEDLHWTDPSTLELLDLLIDQIPTAAICVLLTCRPTFQPTWGNRSYLTPIALNRLSHSQIERMAERVAGGKHLPNEVLQQIVEKTDGVPLFIEEMTKSVLESGLLKETDKQYELTGSFSSLAIPATLQDSLMARLDRLVTSKAVAQYASVIGRQFSYALLRTVSQLDEPTLQRELGRLVEAELIYQRGLPPQATYLFKHALIQDTAYQSLLKSTRQQYHQRIAQVLAERFSETTQAQPELLAYHFTEAGLNEQALPYWQQAGQRANERSAHTEAVAHLTAGLKVLKTFPETPQRTQHELTLYLSLGLALMATQGQQTVQVERVFRRAHVLCQQVGETPQLFDALGGLNRFYFARGELHTARDLGEQFLRLAQGQGDPALLLAGHWMLGTPLTWLGEVRAAHDHFERSLALYEPQRHRFLAFRYAFDPGSASLAYTVITLWALGYPTQARQRSQEALELAQTQAHPFSLAYVHLVVTIYSYLDRAWQSLYDRTEAMLALSIEHGFALWILAGTFLRGCARAALGQRGEGLAQMRQGQAGWRATILGMPFLIMLADAYGKMGQFEAGLRVLNEARDVMKTTGNRFMEAEIYRLKGEFILALPDVNVSEAEACFHQALDTARQQQAKSWELRAVTSLARLWQSQGKRQAAHDLLAPVYNWFTEGFATADLKDAKTLLDAFEG